MQKIITLGQLRTAGACQNQRKLFEETFGNSVEITEEICLAHANKFCWDWAAKNLLSPKAWAE
ncbi:MAG: hypothetical protein P4N59_11620, partial [Negativicutes bacterium]|nr:hypothetical protein [Negativicutes bacterium]